MEHAKLPWHAKLENFSERGNWEPAQIWSEWETPEPKIVADLAARSTMEANALLIVTAVNAHEILVEALRVLARFGNGPLLGNSRGNEIAISALKKAGIEP